MDLVHGDLKTLIRKIAFPASIGWIFNTLFNVVDTYYAGHLDTLALAGLALSFPIFFIIIATGSGIGTGTTALLSNAHGAGDEEKGQVIVCNAIVLAGVFSLVITFSGLIFSRSILQSLGVSGDALTYGLSYLHVLFAGSGFFVFNATLNAMLVSKGNTKPYRNFLVIGFFMNLILDPLFMLGWFGLPRMGTAGIALATILIQFFGTNYLIRQLKKETQHPFHGFCMKSITWQRQREILAQGIPASLNMMTIAIGFFVINRYVLLYGGDIAMAAYGAAIRIEQVALLPTLGLNIATLSLVGQNFGAQNPARVRKIYRLSLGYAVTMMTLGMIVVYPLAPRLVALFNDTPQVIAIGSQFLRIEVIAFNTYVLMGISNSVLQGLKRPKMIFFIGITRQFILPMIVFPFLGGTRSMGVLGVWWGIVLITWTAAIFSIFYTLRTMRKVLTN